MIITLFTGPPGWCYCRRGRGHGGNEITFLYLKWKTHICSGQAKSSQVSSQPTRHNAMFVGLILNGVREEQVEVQDKTRAQHIITWRDVEAISALDSENKLHQR